MSDKPDADLAAAIQDERRLEDRHVVHWPILLSWTTPAGPAVARGRTLDLCFGGVRVAAEHNFTVGDKLACRISVQPWHGNSDMFDIDTFVKVMHCAYSAQNGGFEVGLQFQTFSGDGKERLATLVKALQQGVNPAGAKVLRSSRRS